MSPPRRIDTHHHMVPAFYRAWLQEQGMTAGGLAIPVWEPETALAAMERLSVATAVMSVSTPGVFCPQLDTAASMARRVNEYAAELMRDHPGRFGYFATVPQQDPAASLREAEYALDHLSASGIVLLTNVGGEYPVGEPWEDFLAALQQRNAVVFVHPNEPPIAPLPGVPAHVADFLLDTTRAAIAIARAGYLTRFDRVRFLLSHAGGFLPFAAERVARSCAEDGSTERGLELLRRFYFDTALASSPYALASLLAFAEPDHITFGSDWPYANLDRSAHFTGLLEGAELPATLRAAIDRDNAWRLLPGLRA